MLVRINRIDMTAEKNICYLNSNRLVPICLCFIITDLSKSYLNEIEKGKNIQRQRLFFSRKLDISYDMVSKLDNNPALLRNLKIRF
jgi:hypothetical protein